MNKLVFALAAALILCSCTHNEETQSSYLVEAKGVRNFKIQNSKPAFKVALFGVKMGTPDTEEVWSVIDEAAGEGLIDSIVQFALPIEGGIAHCIVVHDATARAQILADLKAAPTSLIESSYTVESVDDCSQE